jgi:hypothetical protein
MPQLDLAPCEQNLTSPDRSAIVEPMPLSTSASKRRLERAAELRLVLRRATLDLREMGHRALAARRNHPRRPDQRRAARD